MARRLNEREALFVAYYQAAGETYLNATKSALKAGYSPKSSHKIGSQLLAKPKIREAIERGQAKKLAEITKENFIDKAMQCFESLPNEESNKARFLELAGKATGILGSNSEKPTTQNVQINLIGNETKDQLLDYVRKLLSDTSSTSIDVTPT